MRTLEREQNLTAEELQAAVEARRRYNRSYMQLYRRRNPEAVKRANLAYWARRAQREQQKGGGAADA